LYLCNCPVNEIGFPGIREAVLGAAFENHLRQYGRITNVERDKLIIGNAFLAGFFSLLVYEKLVKGIQQKRPEPTLGGICPFQHTPAENDFVKESLGQILGFFISIAFASEVAVDGLPISLKQQTYESLVLVLMFPDTLNQRPMSCEE
jgi:hypothetical protein